MTSRTRKKIRKNTEMKYTGIRVISTISVFLRKLFLFGENDNLTRSFSVKDILSFTFAIFLHIYENNFTRKKVRKSAEIATVIQLPIQSTAFTVCIQVILDVVKLFCWVSVKRQRKA